MDRLNGKTIGYKNSKPGVNENEKILIVMYDIECIESHSKVEWSFRK